MRKPRRLTALLLCCCFCCALIPAARADGGFSGGTYTVPAGMDGYAAYLSDGDVMSYLPLRARESVTVTWTGEAAGVLVSWGAAAGGYTVTQRSADGTVLSAAHGESRLLTHSVSVSADCRSLTLTPDAGAMLCAFVPYATLPDGVHLFAEPEAEPTLLLVASYPHGVFTDFGGLLPLYTAERGISTAVAVLASQTRIEQEELLDALWSLGIRQQPYFLGFTDAGETNLRTLRKSWGDTAAVAALAGLIETLTPAVLVASAGESAAGALTQALLTDALKKSGHTPQRVFFANAPKGDGDAAAVTVRWDTPLASFYGRSAQEAAQEAYASMGSVQYLSLAVQKSTEFTVQSGSTAGEDLLSGLADGLLCSSCIAMPHPEAGATAAADDPLEAYFRQAGEAAEVVSVDTENGFWEYRSDLLSIVIERHTDASLPLVWFVAHIRMRENAVFASLASADRNGSSLLSPWQMARADRAVLWITGDNLVFAEKEQKGILIRSRRIYSRINAQDVCAFYADMRMELWESSGLTPERLLASGAIDTYGFGPVLVADGAASDQTLHHRTRSLNPRTGVGMIEPGHFVAIVVDGRQPTYSIGVTLADFAQMFIDEGCPIAYNMDGGVSAAMVFMGEQLNMHGYTAYNDPNKPSLQRRTPDGIAWGKSELVPSLDDPIYNNGQYQG